MAIRLAVVLTAGFLLRLTALGRHSLWLDEAFSFYASRPPLVQLPGHIAQADIHPPLFYMILHTVSDRSEFLLRLPSAFASLLAVAASAALTTQLAGRRAGVASALVVSMSAYQVWYAQEARMYAPLTAAVVLAGLSVLRLKKSPFVWAPLFVISASSALYLQYAAVWPLLGFVLFLMLGERRPANAWKAGALGLALFLLYIPWLPEVHRDLQVVTHSFELTPTDLSVPRHFFLEYLSLGAPAMVKWMGWVLGGVALVSIGWLAVERHRSALFLVLWLACGLALPLLVGLISGQSVVRPAALSPTAVGLYVALSIGLTRLPRFLAAAALLAFWLLSISGIMSSMDSAVKEDWRGAVAVVMEGQEEYQAVTLAPEYLNQPFRFYLEQTDGSQPDLVGPLDLRRRATDGSLPWERVWVVSSWHHPQDLGLAEMVRPWTIRSERTQRRGLTLWNFELATR